MIRDRVCRQMSSKEEERYYVETLAAVVPELAAAELKESEAPDFLIETPSGIIGVEVTEFDDPPTPGMPRAMEQAGLRDWIVSQARTLYTGAGGAPLHVSVLFTEYPPLTKQRSRTLAQQLAQFLIGSSRAFISYSQSRFLDDVTSEHFPEIASISAVRVPDDSYSSWSTGAGGWVRHASAVEVQRIVSKKEARLPTYRLRCTHAWGADCVRLVCRGRRDPCADRTRRFCRTNALRSRVLSQRRESTNL